MHLLSGLGGGCNNVEAIGQSRISQWMKGWQFKQVRLFRAMKRTCQNSNLNPL